jgi:hypothetical protein
MFALNGNRNLTPLLYMPFRSLYTDCIVLAPKQIIIILTLSPFMFYYVISINQHMHYIIK